MASVTVHCPRCQSAQVYRNGDTTGSAAGTATACFSSLTHTKSANPRLKSRSPKWLSTVPGFAIQPGR